MPVFVKWLLGLGGAALLIVIALFPLGLIKMLQGKAIGEHFANQGTPPTAVNLDGVQRAEWEVTLPSVGSVTSVQGVVVRPEVAGVVRTIAFTAGSTVETGDLLVALDTTVERANLEQAEAELDLAERTLARSQKLFDSRSVPEAELDAARSQLTAAMARVASLKATLQKREIRAPFAGRLGIKEISVGQFVNPGDAIVVLQAIDPVFIEFSLPQRELSKVRTGMAVKAVIDAYPGEIFEGTLTAINPELDPATRNFLLQATFSNHHGKLLPGMYARTEVIMPDKRQVLMVPSISVIYSPSGNRLYIAKTTDDGLVATQAIVRLGEVRGDYVEVTAGLEGDEQIVVDGAFKLREGVPIFESEAGTVKPELDPQPENS